MKTLLLLCLLFAPSEQVIRAGFTGNGIFAAEQFYNPCGTITSYQAISKKEVAESFHSLKSERKIKPGKRLLFKEKAALCFHTLFHPFNPELERKANNQAKTGFVLSLLGFVSFWPLLIAGLIVSNSALTKERINPGILTSRNYKLAKTGRVLAIIGLFIIVISFIIILSNGGFYSF